MFIFFVILMYLLNLMWQIMNNSFILYIKGGRIFARQFSICAMSGGVFFSGCFGFRSCNSCSGVFKVMCFWGRIFNAGEVDSFDYVGFVSKQFDRVR